MKEVIDKQGITIEVSRYTGETWTWSDDERRSLENSRNGEDETRTWSIGSRKINGHRQRRRRHHLLAENHRAKPKSCNFTNTRHRHWRHQCNSNRHHHVNFKFKQWLLLSTSTNLSLNFQVETCVGSCTRVKTVGGFLFKLMANWKAFKGKNSWWFLLINYQVCFPMHLFINWYS